MDRSIAATFRQLSRLRSASSRQASGLAVAERQQGPTSCHCTDTCSCRTRSFATATLDPGLPENEEASSQEQRRAEISRMLYRARQRGFLELDLLVGQWAEQQVPTMDRAALDAFQEVLQQENPDMFKWITGQAPASASMLNNPVFKALQEDVQKQLHLRRPEETAAQPGRNWVRGWDDSWRQNSSESAPVPDTGATSRT